MKKLIVSVCAVIATVFGLGGVAALSPVMAEPAYADSTTAGGQYISQVQPAGASSSDLMTTVKNIINVILGIVGIVAVVMMIVGGISFITSQGDSGKVTKARNTILYGVVGLVVALLAFAIVNFVLTSLFSSK